MVVKGLPLAYNRDLQEDKEPLFDAFDTVEGCLKLATLTVEGANFRFPTRIAGKSYKGFLDATTLMEFLIKGGVPQRTAHEVIGMLVSSCERRGLQRLSDLSDADLIEAHPKLDREGSYGSWEYKMPLMRLCQVALRHPFGSQEASRKVETRNYGKGCNPRASVLKSQDPNIHENLIKTKLVLWLVQEQ